MILIQRQVLSSSAASVTFSNIPQNYKTLRMLVSARGDVVQTDDYGILQFNSDTGSNYPYRQLYGNGSSALSNSGTLTGAALIRMAATNATSNTFGSIEIVIPNYTGSTAKVASADGVGENNGTTATQSMWAALWTGTSAITTIAVKPGSSTNFVSGSSFSLYGLL